MKDNFYKKFFSAGWWYFASSFILKCLAFLTIPIFSRILSQSEYGIISNYATSLSIILVFVSLNIHVSVQRAISDLKDEIYKFLSTIIIFVIFLTILFFFLVYNFTSFFTLITGIDATLLYLLVLMIPFNSILSIFYEKTRFEFKYKLNSVVTVICTVSSLVLSIVFVLLFSNKLYSKIIGSTIPGFILAFVFGIYYLIKGKSFKIKYLKYALLISCPLIFHSIASLLLLQSDRLIITNVLGSDITGLYVMACNATVISKLIISSLNSAWVPHFFDKMEREEYSDIKLYSNICLIILVFVNIFFLATAPEFIKIIAPENYYDCIKIVPILLFSTMFDMIYVFYVNIQFYFKKTKLIPVSTILATIINIVLNIILIPIFGYYIAAFTTLIGTIALAIFHRLSTNHIFKERIFDEKYFLKVSFVMLGLTIIYLMLYNTVFLRYLFTFLLFTVVIIKTKLKIKIILNHLFDLLRFN